MRPIARIALYCFDPTLRRRIESALLGAGLPVGTADATSAQLILYAASSHDEAADARRIADLKNRSSGSKVILLSEEPMGSRTPDALRFGADDLVLECCNPAVLIPRIRDHLDACGQVCACAKAGPDTSELVGKSAAMRAVRDQIELVAPSEATVLLTGETGTGKECAARMVHRRSGRARGPFVAVNCAAIPEALLEGELFGYERGAFTGAHKAYPGKLKIADHGTLVFDEVGDLTLAGQAKILRAIETKEVYRLGGAAPERFDARIVAATNVELAERMMDGGFRKDLYYRLAVARIHLPPLRERREDIGSLARHFLERLAAKTGREVEGFDAEALDILCAHDWPGNARELGNVVEMALLSSPGPIVRARALPCGFADKRCACAPRQGGGGDERDRLVKALGACGGNKSLAAKSLKWSRMTLYRKLGRYELTTTPARVTPDL